MLPDCGITWQQALQIRARVNQIMAKRRKAAELTEQRLLDDMLLECELATAAVSTQQL